MKKILIEGWRNIAHSYAIVNMWQCLELMNRQGYQIYHNDQTLLNPDWPVNPEIINREVFDKLSTIPFLSDINQADVIYRIDYPHRFNNINNKRLLVFATSETHLISRENIFGKIEFKEAINNSNAIIITPSNWSAKGFIICGANPERVKVIPHGVEPRIFKPIPLNEKKILQKLLGLDGNFIFLNISAMSHNKGIPILLKTFARIIKYFPKCKLLLKGVDEIFYSNTFLWKYNLKLSKEELNLILPNLLYQGKTIPLKRLAQFYQLSDAYVAPYHNEGFNMPVLEAAACGLPVICTAGGPTDDFTNEYFAKRIASSEKLLENGKTTLEPDPDHLFEHMKSVIENKQFIEQAHDYAPNFVRENYSWQKIVDQLLAVMFPVSPK